MSWLRSVLGKLPLKEVKPTIDRKSVIRAYEETLMPVLKDNGFDLFGISAPTKNPAAWRHREKWVDTFELFFVRPEERRKLATNTMSFSITVGRHFLFIPYIQAELPTSAEGLSLPYSVACELVYSPKKSIKQREVNVKTLWHIDSDGGNLVDVIDDARRVIINDALLWLSQWDDLSVLLRRLLEEHNDDSPLVWQGFGGKGSPLRNFMIGFTALELGQFDLAITHLRQALNSKVFSADARMPEKHALDDQILLAIAQIELNGQAPNRRGPHRTDF